MVEQDPTRGWIDSVSAVGAILLFAGLGIVKTFKGDFDNLGDIVPVDIVSDYIIAVAYTYRNRREFTVKKFLSYK